MSIAKRNEDDFSTQVINYLYSKKKWRNIVLYFQHLQRLIYSFVNDDLDSDSKKKVFGIYINKKE